MLNIMGISHITTIPVCVYDIKNIHLSNALVDTLRIDNKIKDSFDISEVWEKESVMYGKFQENLYAGNTELSISNTSDIIIKRRKKGEFNWFSMFNIPVDSVSSLNFNLIDRYLRLETDYQYAVVPIINGLEGEYSFGLKDNGENFIRVSYEGVIIMDRDNEFCTLFDVSYNEKMNVTKSDVVGLSRKYPLTVKNTINRFYSGTLSATFFKTDECNYIKDESMFYRENLIEFLANDNMKIIKLYDGRIRMCEIINSIEDSSDEHPEKHTISVSFTEKGDTESYRDMYINSFLDISEAWWTWQ